MVKFMYPIWKQDDQDGDAFRDELLTHTVPALRAISGVERLRLAVVDGDVAPAAGRRLESFAPLADGVITIYAAAPLDGISVVLNTVAKRSEVFGVEETVAIGNTDHPERPGERLFGFCQMVFLQRPERLSEEQWRHNWQRLHTPVAIEIQANFSYRQNRVISQSDENTLPIHALVEESFVPAAMTSDRAFYGVHSEEELAGRQTQMMESCSRFLDYDKIDVIPMSEYCC